MAANKNDKEIDSLISAMEALVREHANPLFRYAFRLVANTDEAHDAVQESFLRVQTMMEKRGVDWVPNRKGYLFTTCRNYIFDQKRKSSRSTTIPMQEEFGEENLHAFLNTNHLTSLEKDRAEAIAHAISGLNTKHQEIIIRVYVQGYLPEEIAKKEGTTVEAIYQRLARLRKRIRQDAEKIISGKALA